MRIFALTGTYHGSIVNADTEGKARRMFHTFWNGESIVFQKELKYYF